MPKFRPLKDRFWEKVEKTDTCWLWTAATNGLGYGRIALERQQVNTYAHRLSYEWAYGPIPNGMSVDHICHQPACVNPAHLRAVTHKQNMEHRQGASVQSKSGIQGVSWSRADHRWVVHVSHAGKGYYGGGFVDIKDAEAAAIALRNRLFTHNDADRNVHSAPVSEDGHVSGRIAAAATSGHARTL